MVDQRDVRAGKKTPRDIVVECSQSHDEMRLARDERAENSLKPSIWEYNPKGGVPTELVNLDPSTFLTSRQGQILCSLPRDVLARFCSMLSVCDFFYLSLTCRFLHWRMFTFCTCSVPQTVIMRVRYDQNFTDFWDIDWDPLKWVNNGVLDLDDDRDDYFHIGGSNEAVAIRQPLMEAICHRGFFVYQQFCLRKPFFFDSLELQLVFPSYCKKYYNMCLPYILAVRGLARHLNVIFLNHHPPLNRFFNYPETNDFLEDINANFYDSIDRRNIGRTDKFFRPNRINKAIYINCPYARQMNMVRLANTQMHDIIDVPVFQNKVGIYVDPLDLPIIATLKNFLTGSTNLVYHQYVYVEKNNGRFPLIEYLFQQFGKFEEFFYAQRIRKPHYDYHAWKKVVGTENGGQLRIFIAKRVDGINGHVRIGKEEMFDEMDKKYSWLPLYYNCNIWWKMETAVEPDETGELGEIDESAKVKRPIETEESNVAVEPKAEISINLCGDCKGGDVRRAKDEEWAEAVEQDEDEEEQGACGACLCLNNTSCSIQ